jgi:hypothetical protein
MEELVAMLDDVAGLDINEEVFTQETTLGLWHLYSHLANDAS